MRPCAGRPRRLAWRARRQDAERAQADSQAAQARLARLSEDSAVLAQAPAIERLNAQAGDLDEHLAGLSDATTLVEQWRQQGQALAARIDATLPVTELVALTPSPSTRAVIEERLRALEAAEQAMASHQAALAQLADEEARSAPAQTPQVARRPPTQPQLPQPPQPPQPPQRRPAPAPIRPERQPPPTRWPACGRRCAAPGPK